MLTGKREPGDAVDERLKKLAAHPLISGKVSSVGAEPRSWLARIGKDRRFPSYMNSKTFALSFLDTVAPPAQGASHDVLARARAYAGELKDGDPVKQVLTAFLDQAGNDVHRFRRSVEMWFDLTMDRVSGWYKRRAQFSLVVIAVAVTLACNADALQVGRALWNDDVVRASVVAQAQKAVENDDATTDVGDSAKPDDETLADQVADVRSLELPLGWNLDPDDPRWFDSFGGLLGKLLGLAATTIALTLGAPFWFDLLGRVSRLRSSGKPERAGAA
jgi:hypothetical protein